MNSYQLADILHTSFIQVNLLISKFYPQLTPSGACYELSKRLAQEFLSQVTR